MKTKYTLAQLNKLLKEGKVVMASGIGGFDIEFEKVASFYVDLEDREENMSGIWVRFESEGDLELENIAQFYLAEEIELK